MKIVALLTVRNEERYLRVCLEHLHKEGVKVCLIDNGSTDRTLEIAESFKDKNVIRIEHFPFSGSFALKPILENEERLASEIEADWFIHHDADEIRQSVIPDKTLQEAITEVDNQGYNAINFDEFVFVPTEEDTNHNNKNYFKTMRYYYFFEPEKVRRINAWKNLKQKVDIANSGGHRISFKGQKIFPHSFILRHYIVQSRAHAVAKFCGRVYSEKEIADQHWHGYRPRCKPSDIILPKISELKEINQSKTFKWDKSDIWKTHFYAKIKPLSRKEILALKLKKITGLFQPAFPENSIEQNQNTKNRLPVPFIVGVGRSGSTLLRLMLDSHPELAIPPETHFIPDILKLLKSQKDSKKSFFKTIVRHPHWPDFHLSKKSFKEQLNNLNPFTISEGLRTFYFLYAEKFNKKRWGDKTPPYDHNMIEISKLLPEVRFIHIIRDGRDVALSYRGKWFGPGNNIEELANHWVYRIRETRRQAQHLSHYMEIRFEDLVNDPETSLKTLCNFIELPFSPQMLEYYKTADSRLAEMENRYDSKGKVKLTKERRLEIFQLTNKPPDKNRIQCWRKEMSSEDRKRFEIVAGDLLRDLKYEHI